MSENLTGQLATRPRWRRLKVAVKIAGAAFILILLTWEFLIWPWSARWGATAEEAARSLPSDRLVVNPGPWTTHAITINAPPREVWKWLLQVGQDRGGFYSYDKLERLFGAEIYNVYEIRPEWQSRSVGDDLWMAPKSTGGGQVRLKIARIETDRLVVFVSPQEFEKVMQTGTGAVAAWVWIIEALPDNRSRLIMRLTGTRNMGFTGHLLTHLVLNPAHFIMERKMLLTLRTLAETGRP